MQRKTITLTLPTGESVQVIYSALQADPEVIYDIRTTYQPMFLQAPHRLAGQVLDKPYRQHVQAVAWRTARKQGPWVALALVGVVGAAVRCRQKINGS